MKAVWAGALALAVLLCVALFARYAPPDPELAFVGSSIINSAVPPVSPPEGLLADGRTHEMRVLGGMSERQATDLLGMSIQLGFHLIVVEIYPFIRTQADERGTDLTPLPSWFEGASWVEGIIPSWDDVFSRFGMKFRTAVRICASRIKPLGRMALLVGSAEDSDEVYNGGREGFDSVYPPDLHQPRDPMALEKVLAKAHATEASVVFVALPSPKTVDTFLGPIVDTRLKATIEEFRQRFGVEVWTPGLSWPDDHFSDRVHFNERGRVRFVEALRAHFGNE